MTAREPAPSASPSMPVHGTGAAPIGGLAEAQRVLFDTDPTGRPQAVIAPSECGYLLLTTDRATAAVAARDLSAKGSVIARLLPGSAEAIAHVSATGMGKRLMQRLLPGPVVFRPAGSTEGVRVVRTASTRLLSSIAADLGREVWAVELLASHRGSKHAVPARDGADAIAAVRRAGIAHAAMVDEGVSVLGEAATVVELLDVEPGYRVAREGALEARYIEKRTRLTILFVCTGNTCRSPMAEAIAVDLLGVRGGTAAGKTNVLSAGTGAEPGHPITDEAVEALEELGIDVPSQMKGGSRLLTRKLLAEADVVFGMTRSHVQAALEIDPSAMDKVMLIDPAGKDVPDPIGLPASVYTDTARRLRDAISLRLRELDA